MHPLAGSTCVVRYSRHRGCGPRLGDHGQDERSTTTDDPARTLRPAISPAHTTRRTNGGITHTQNITNTSRTSRRLSHTRLDIPDDDDVLAGARPFPASPSWTGLALRPGTRDTANLLGTLTSVPSCLFGVLCITRPLVLSLLTSSILLVVLCSSVGSCPSIDLCVSSLSLFFLPSARPPPTAHRVSETGSESSSGTFGPGLRRAGGRQKGDLGTNWTDL